ncbi:hypothetical protein phiAS5_ORF0021 [Aeromonas phage phiAS5]|uniref:Ryanodine receptor Ryr domain-containing protein n=1 Tax=Aeromonas phage phiAS5 TaxID=879630 RepID=E1A2B8_9CAUD|nr:hypothetical protein phiAS5_ORF0021 [Aeromonas phage phiAS5]ADM79864.1 hypothetical protein phiAS5_ORF0021 [Aeromonas phage phiAS5]BES53029.1 hypothetical protein [Aeromonas phage phiWae14]
MKAEQIARVCHEMNRIYCLLLGDNSIKHWEDAEEAQRNSSIIGVKEIMANPDRTPAESHECWKRVQIENGWKYGEVKDFKLKTHPCLVDYEDLPFEQKIKDEMFVSIVNTLM